MVKSMTGFGRSQNVSQGFTVIVEIKTVNHRFCEYHIRMPRQLLKIEDKIKKLLGENIQRGRVEVFITVEGQGIIHKKVNIDWDLLDEYYQYISEVIQKYNLQKQISIKDLIQREEWIQIEDVDTENEELENLVLQSVSEASTALQKMRIVEGNELKADIRKQLTIIDNIIERVTEFTPIVVQQYKERLAKRMQDFSAGTIDEYRLITEVAVFADRVDINEELARLKSHIGQFEETLTLTEPIGRKLDFLLQEMNREVNTIGSKANDSKLAKEVVEMKSLLEKIKEQVQNIE